jgi:2,3-diaminopropionate biosynthesis protein SbnA
MTVFTKVQDIVLDDVFLELPGLVAGPRVLLKIEGLGPSGSIKMKTALGLVEEFEAKGLVRGGCRLIESSSGNLGIALAMICAQRGIPLTIVTDPNVSTAAEGIMRALGADLVKVTDRDANDGYLHTRIAYIHEAIRRDRRLIWLNQYANRANVAAHRERTARRLHEELGAPDVLVVGVGTAGTLMGCLEYFQVHSPATRIVAADSEGSVTLGGTPGRRRIPGIGASRTPEIFQDTDGFDRVLVPECEAVQMCRRIARRYGVLVGGSTGTALVAAERIAPSVPESSRVVVISPDLGDRYLDTIYSDSWVALHFPEVIERESEEELSCSISM